MRDCCGVTGTQFWRLHEPNAVFVIESTKDNNKAIENYPLRKHIPFTFKKINFIGISLVKLFPLLQLFQFFFSTSTSFTFTFQIILALIGVTDKNSNPFSVF